jgi:hypothetical protein
MSQQSVLLKARGLYTFPNQLSEVPQGALVKADNVIINRDGVIEPRRGFAIYGDAMGVSPLLDTAKQLLVYKNRILRHFNSTLEFDNGSGTFTAFTGSIDEVDAGLRLKSVESNGNLYFTTSTGVKKISETSGANLTANSITKAGGVKALDAQLSLNSEPGFLPSESIVAYRIVWGIKDANNNVILGRPSESVTISNSLVDLLIVDFNNLMVELEANPTLSYTYTSLDIPQYSTATVVRDSLSNLCNNLDIDLSSTDFTTIKAEIDALTFSEIPSNAQLNALKDAYNDVIAQLSIVLSAPFQTATESSTVNVTFTVPQDITNLHFYQIYRTAVSKEKDEQNILINPGEEFGLVYEDNPTSAELSSKLVTVHDVTPDSFRRVNLYTNPNTGEGINQANDPPPKCKDVTMYKNYVFYANTETNQRLTINLLSITNFVPNVSTLKIVAGATENIYTFSDVEDVATKKVKLSTAETVAQQVDETARSLVRVINRNSSDKVYAYYISGVDDVPGEILLESKELNQAAFYLNVGSSTYSDQFNPKIPESGDAVISDNDVAPNRIFYSKVNQPEAVPILNYFDVGPRDKQIQRVVALRESLFILKDEGIYRLSGDSAPFVVNLFDSSTLLSAPDSATVLNNQIYALTYQGVAQISDTGIAIISRPIEDELIKLNNPSYLSAKTASFGIGYESDRNYYLWTVSDLFDTVATQCFRYNIFTNAWCRMPIAKTCAIVNPQDDKLYLGASDTNYIEKERKNFDRTDYADREYELILPVSGVNGNVISVPSVANTEVSDVLVQTQYLTISQYNRLLLKLDRDAGVADSDYYNTLHAVAGDNLRVKLTDLAQKLDNDPGIDDPTFEAAISSFGTSFSQTQAAFNEIVEKLNTDEGVVYSNYLSSEGTVELEIAISEVNKKNLTITTPFAYPFIAGPIILYKRIQCVVQYTPQTFGDPSMLKQVSESTVLFEKTSFSQCNLSFSTDLNPSFVTHTFYGNGNGIFGSGVFGANIFGGDGNSKPFRTLVPREKQRCRFINVKVEHSIAREIFAIFGISLTIAPTSQRAYK